MKAHWLSHFSLVWPVQQFLRVLILMQSFEFPSKSRFWADLGTLDFSKIKAHPNRNAVVAVLPVAATEQHGPHLPVSVDSDLVEAVIQASLGHLPKQLPVLFLPTQVIGKSNEHIDFAGTLSLSSQTILSLWTDIGAGVARAGISKLVLFNSHGGNVSMMDMVARDLREAHNLMVYSSNWYSLPIDALVLDEFSADEHRFGIHAGDIETSMMLACRPERVDMARAKNFASSSQQRAQKFPIIGNGKSAKLGWLMQDYNPDGAAGNASAATAEKGRRLIDSAGQQLALMLAEISSLSPNTLAPRV
jgi:creatinine amidohydrolase